MFINQKNQTKKPKQTNKNNNILLMAQTYEENNVYFVDFPWDINVNVMLNYCTYLP